MHYEWKENSQIQKDSTAQFLCYPGVCLVISHKLMQTRNWRDLDLHCLRLPECFLNITKQLNTRGEMRRLPRLHSSKTIVEIHLSVFLRDSPNFGGPLLLLAGRLGKASLQDRGNFDRRLSKRFLIGESIQLPLEAGMYNKIGVR